MPCLMPSQAKNQISTDLALLFLYMYITHICCWTICCDKAAKEMGLLASSMKKGSEQLVHLAMGVVCQQFVKEDMKDFDTFHKAVLDVFTSFNVSLPGTHYDAPRRNEVEELFKQWKAAADEKEKKDIFIKFMEENVKLSRADNTTLFTGILMPPLAMAAKRTGENVPQLKMIKNVPDVLFVPSATVIALISVKISRRIFMKTKALESQPTQPEAR